MNLGYYTSAWKQIPISLNDRAADAPWYTSMRMYWREHSVKKEWALSCYVRDPVSFKRTAVMLSLIRRALHHLFVPTMIDY